MKTDSSSALTTSSLTRVRCINLDWLEVHAFEPIDQPHDVEYFTSCGFIVSVRDYGTRVYRQMFTLMGSDGLPLLEVRRDPASQGLNGIHQPNETHIRLVNRTCYYDNAAGMLAKFLDAHHYTDVRISRVDVCMDFVKFDRNDDPAAFIRRYFAHHYSKINQSNITGHGADTWHGQEWNSVSWGAPTSDVGTKMYDKTMELYDAKLDAYRKPYIRESWLRCHIIDDVHRCTLKGEKVRVWRVEFSVRSSVKKWYTIELDGHQHKYQSIRNTLDCWDGRDKLLVMFASLARHYFRFKYFEPNQRKDRCRDKVLFVFDRLQTTYKIGRDTAPMGAGDPMYRPLDRLIAKIRAYQEQKTDPEVVRACDVLLKALRDDCLRSDLTRPWDSEELAALRRIMHIRSRHPDLHWRVVMQEVRDFLNIRDNTINFCQQKAVQ